MKIRIILAIMLLVTLGCVPSYSDTAISDADNLKLSKVERYVYGDIQTGLPDKRAGQLEEDLFGRQTAKSLKEKVQYLHDFIFKGNSDTPSMDMKLSFLEWKLFNKTGQGDLETRLAKLDRQVIGAVSFEPAAFRLEQLVHLTIENGLISLHSVVIPAGTEIKLKIGKTISSRNSKKGDIVQMTLAQDMFVNHNILVLSHGGIISSKVASVRRGGRFGRSGYINLDIDSIESMDSTEIPVRVSYAGQERFDKKRIGMAAGASTLGYFILGPIGLAGGAFVKGDDIEVPAGTEIMVKTTEDRRVTGVLVHRK
jgi:hypothetical protein